MSWRECPSIRFLEQLALDAGQMILDGFGVVGVELKEDGTPVTEVDKAINSLVIEKISENFPHISVIGEEENRIVEDSKYVIYCDPLDGTIPYTWGLPISTFSIALVKNGCPLVGVIYDPFMKRLWSAIRKERTLLNSLSAKVSRHSEIEHSKLCIFNWHEAICNVSGAMDEIMKRNGRWINPASVAIVGGLLALGKIDGIIFPSRDGWETAAMQVIVEEAGGKVTDIHGDKIEYSPEGKINGSIFSNGLIHDELVEILTDCQ